MENRQGPINKAEGVTASERYLSRLAKRTFLSLWSYSGIFRDQKWSSNKKGDGKEVCDLLVVFENHILIFSDKDCDFPNTGNLELDWQRWFRKAIEKSAHQIRGAERWIKTNPDRLFLDRACSQSFPLKLPNPSTAKFHRIIVAHGASQRCKKELGGSGSLMIHSDIIGSQHHLSIKDGGMPFAIGQVDSINGYIHVFDDTTLDIVMTTLDTINDFVSYLSRKEDFISTRKIDLVVAGEEDLLAWYLENYDDDGDHDFILPNNTKDKGIDFLMLEEGFWEDFIVSPKRHAQLEANTVSYFWDQLIENFSRHILDGTQYYAYPSGIAEQEKNVRLLARESRFKRRLLASSCPKSGYL